MKVLKPDESHCLIYLRDQKETAEELLIRSTSNLTKLKSPFVKENLKTVVQKIDAFLESIEDSKM